MSTMLTAAKRNKMGTKRKYRSNSTSSMQLQKMVKREILKTIETKEFPYFLDSNAMTTTDSICINAMPQTDSAQGRDGNRIIMKGIQLKVAAVPLATSVGDQLFRWAVVLDKQSNGETPLWSQITTNAVVSDPALSPLNPNYYSRFQILATDTAMLSQRGADKAYFIERYIDLKNLEASYAGSNGTFTSVFTNAIYFFMVPSNQAFFSFGTADADYTMSASLTFKDI